MTLLHKIKEGVKTNPPTLNILVPPHQRKCSYFLLHSVEIRLLFRNQKEMSPQLMPCKSLPQKETPVSVTWTVVTFYS